MLLRGVKVDLKWLWLMPHPQKSPHSIKDLFEVTMSALPCSYQLRMICKKLLALNS